MSKEPLVKFKVDDIMSMKGGRPIVCLTSYTAPFAAIIDKHVDLILVGDSVGMVLYGMSSTLPVTLDMMINHGKAVVSQAKHACVVVDMPFSSYQRSKEQAYENAARILADTGCQAVKLEGGVEMQETIEFLVKRGIAVMGHIGLMPQHINVEGKYKCKGKTEIERELLQKDAQAVQDAGAFSIVLENTQAQTSKLITNNLAIPSIGIGACKHCDGQILVTEDMAGLYQGKIPNFVRVYAELAKNLDQAVEKYANEVRDRAFPT